MTSFIQDKSREKNFPLILQTRKIVRFYKHFKNKFYYKNLNIFRKNLGN